MDNELRNELLKDLGKAVTNDEKLNIISVFLEQLADASVAQSENAVALSKLATNSTTLSTELQKNITLIAERVENTDKHLINAINQITLVMKHLASLEKSQTDIINSVTKLYEKLY